MGPAVIIPLIASLFGGFLQGAGQASAAASDAEARRKQAAKLEDIAALLMGGSGEGPLRSRASREITAAMPTLNANLAQRGLADSGIGANLQSGAISDIIARLATELNQDQLQRLGAAASIYSGGPFGQGELSPFAAFSGAFGSALQSGAGGFLGALPFLGGLGGSSPQPQNPFLNPTGRTPGGFLG